MQLSSISDRLNLTSGEVESANSPRPQPPAHDPGTKLSAESSVFRRIHETSTRLCGNRVLFISSVDDRSDNKRQHCGNNRCGSNNCSGAATGALQRCADYYGRKRGYDSHNSGPGANGIVSGGDDAS